MTKHAKKTSRGPRAALAGAATLVVVAAGAAALTRTPVTLLTVPAATASLTNATGPPGASDPAVTPSATPSATPTPSATATAPVSAAAMPAATATTPAVTASPASTAPAGSFLATEEAQGNDCLLRVPANPLSARGLATPYQLSNGPNTTMCTMANAANLGAFVQATILEPGGRLAEYDPLVVTAGTRPAVAPPVPFIPRGSVITIDTGFQGNIDFLVGPGARYFDQGLPGSPFGQVAFANGPEFFFLARVEHVRVPALGISGADGMTCPTVHDFSLVDQDPSDNVTTTYIVTAGGQTAESGSGAAGVMVNNGSDNLLLDHFLDPALGCTGSELAVPSLSSHGTTEATQATDEILASRDQAAPVALVPVNDPMTTVGADDDIIAGDMPNAGNLSVTKTNLYRAGIGQPLLSGSAVQDAAGFCAGMAGGRTRVSNDLMFETASGSPVAGTALNVFMANRFNVSVTLLNCANFGSLITPIPVPGATVTPAAATPLATPSVTPSPTDTATDPASPAPSDTTTDPATPAPTDTATDPATPPVPTYPAP
jgi:hypothetical protein